MAKKEELEVFAKNIKRWPKKVQELFTKTWQEYTDEVFGESQNQVPIAGGSLLRSGEVREAKVTSNGIESYIVYAVPYARTIHEGKTSRGKKIDLKPVGYRYPHATKTREGKFKFLSDPMKEAEDELMDSLIEDISKSFDSI